MVLLTHLHTHSFPLRISVVNAHTLFCAHNYQIACTARSNKHPEPVEHSAYVLGPVNSTAIATLGRDVTIRCLAGGFPRPTVTWWRGQTMLGFANRRHQMRKDYSLTVATVELADLGPYTCQAYTGSGKPATLTVTLQAYGPVHSSRPEDTPYLRYVLNRPQQPQREPQREREPERRVEQRPGNEVWRVLTGLMGSVTKSLWVMGFFDLGFVWFLDWT